MLLPPPLSHYNRDNRHRMCGYRQRNPCSKAPPPTGKNYLLKRHAWELFSLVKTDHQLQYTFFRAHISERRLRVSFRPNVSLDSLCRCGKDDLQTPPIGVPPDTHRNHPVLSSSAHVGKPPERMHFGRLVAIFPRHGPVERLELPRTSAVLTP